MASAEPHPSHGQEDRGLNVMSWGYTHDTCYGPKKISKDLAPDSGISRGRFQLRWKSVLVVLGWVVDDTRTIDVGTIPKERGEGSSVSESMDFPWTDSANMTLR